MAAVDIHGLTDYDKIRGSIGATDNEVLDGMLDSMDLPGQLVADLNSWLTGKPYATIITEGNSGGATEEQLLALTRLKLYALWYCSEKQARHLSLAIPASISDGKSQMKRFEGVDFEALRSRCAAAAAAEKVSLKALINSETEVITGLTVAVASAHVYDPVTDQG